MQQRAQLSEYESLAYQSGLLNTLSCYSESSEKSYLHSCSANALLGFFDYVLPRSSFKWKRAYLKLMKKFVPELVSTSRRLREAPNLLEKEVSESGFCFKSDERD